MVTHSRAGTTSPRFHGVYYEVTTGWHRVCIFLLIFLTSLMMGDPGRTTRLHRINLFFLVIYDFFFFCSCCFFCLSHLQSVSALRSSCFLSSVWCVHKERGKGAGGRKTSGKKMWRDNRGESGNQAGGEREQGPIISAVSPNTVLIQEGRNISRR